MIEQLHLMRPEWLWAALPALILALLLWRLRSRSGGWQEVIAPELLPYLVGDTASSRGPNLIPFILLGWLLAAVAASGPSWEKIPQPIHQKQDAVVLVLDLSLSMLATDMPPSRLARAQQKLLDLLERRREGQTGLIAYAGDAHVVTPLTDDLPTIANLLPVLSPLMMPVPGSDTAAALDQAVNLLHSAGVARGQILLLTDGVDARSRSEAEALLRDYGTQLSVLGVGTELGAPIPLPRGGFLKDASDNIVIPKLDRDSLVALASATGGRYLDIRIDDSDLDSLLSDTLVPGRDQTVTLDRTADSWDDKGYWLVLMLLPLVLPLFRRGWVIALLPLMLLGGPEQALAFDWEDLWYTPDQRGQRALAQGDHEAAAQLFEASEWAGTAAYRGEDYDTAAKQFARGDTADDWYNRGNALAKAGKIDEAIEAYRESLERVPDQADAAENLALLEQLKEQQQQQDSENQEQQDNQDQQQSGDDGQPQNQDNSDPSQQRNEGEPDPADQQQEQQPPAAPEDGEENQPSESPEEEQAEDSERPGDEQEQPGEPEAAEASAAQAQEATPEEQEQEQAMQQWLRRIPDDPSGLLRNKFRFESQRRQEQGEARQDENYW